MTDTDVTFLSCYNTVGHTRMHVMTLTSPPTLPLFRPWAGLSMRRFMPLHLLIQGSSLLSFLPYSLSVFWMHAKNRLRVFPPVFPQSLGSCPDTQVMTLASSPPSSRCLPFRVCRTLRFLFSQFCRTERSVFRQQFHSCPCTRIMTLASSPPSARCPPFGTSVASISFPST
jgi:hypothetical protein